MPGYRVQRLDTKHPLAEKLTAAERKKIAPTLAKVKALLVNGLIGIDLARCWLAWRIIPLSSRTGLMCDYVGLRAPQTQEVRTQGCERRSLTLMPT